MADRKMRYTENEVDGRHENGVDGENGNRRFATWGEIDVTYTFGRCCGYCKQTSLQRF